MSDFPEMKFEKSYIQRGRVALFQITLPLSCVARMGRADFGTSCKPALLMIKEEVGEWAFEEGEFNALAEKYSKMLADKKKFAERYNRWMETSKKIKGFAWKINNERLRELPEKELKERFLQIEKLSEEFWRPSIFIDTFDPGYDFKEIEQINGKFGFTQQEIQTLTTPARKSYVQEIKFLLFELVENFSEQKKREFLEKFFWIKTDYFEAKRFGEKELLQELQEIKKANWKKEKAELLESMEKLEKQQQEILAKKNLAENPFWFYNELTFWRDERKRYNNVCLFAATQIALEALRRKGMQKFLQYISHQELFALPEKKELEKRIQQGFITTTDGDKIVIYSKKDFEKIFYKAVGIFEAKGDLRGMSASIGTATGRAKIILTPKEFGKMQQGDILVTHMTRPDFVPIMKKAAAIVTDEGGITCHAAIISRELSIPCIVGTKIATKVLKDNDIVEVRANHGLVKKL